MSESFSTLVLKICGPINTIWDTSICSPNRRIMSCMIILRRFLCYPCPIHPYNGSFLSFENVITIRGSFSQIFWGVPLLDPWLVPLLWDGLSLLMKPFLARLICHRSFTCCCYILTCSVFKKQEGLSKNKKEDECEGQDDLQVFTFCLPSGSAAPGKIRD